MSVSEPSEFDRQMAIRRLELEFELETKKAMAEMEAKKAIEVKRAEVESAARKMEVDRELEVRRMELDYELRKTENEGFGAEVGHLPPKWDDTLAGRTKRFGDTLRLVLPMMPVDVGQIPQYFENVEHIFDIYDVPADLRSKLMLPHLSDRAKSLICRLSAESLDDYTEMKRFLLGEFKLTAMEYKARFDKAIKRNDETHILFASRLHNELRYYLSSRNVDSFDKLCNLLVSDKLKSCLDLGTLRYVLSLEGENCFEPERIARLADTYVNYHMGPTVS